MLIVQFQTPVSEFLILDVSASLTGLLQQNDSKRQTSHCRLGKGLAGVGSAVPPSHILIESIGKIRPEQK